MNRSLEKQDKTPGTQSNFHSVQIWDNPFGAVEQWNSQTVGLSPGAAECIYVLQ